MEGSIFDPEEMMEQSILDLFDISDFSSFDDDYSEVSNNSLCNTDSDDELHSEQSRSTECKFTERCDISATKENFVGIIGETAVSMRPVVVDGRLLFEPISTELRSTLSDYSRSVAGSMPSESLLPAVLRAEELVPTDNKNLFRIDPLEKLALTQRVDAISAASLIVTNAISPKHIYKTACDTYRVQVGKGNKTKPNGKFSRNTRSEVEAMWLCELALLFIDCPKTLEEMMSNGNYNCLHQRGLVSSPQDFLMKLTYKAEDMRERLVLKDWESANAAASLKEIISQLPCGEDSEECNMKYKRPLDIKIEQSVKNEHENDVRKRRRRQSSPCVDLQPTLVPVFTLF